MSQLNVAVTGASGHIGANLVRALINQGRHVRVLEHLSSCAFDGLDVEIVKGDVCDIDSLNKLFSDVDIVYHLAAKIYLGNERDSETEKVNILGTKNVAQACLAKNIKRLIHFSSIHSLSPYPLNEVVDEQRPFISGQNAPCYDLTKAASEREILKAVKQGLDAIILNPCGVIGPNDFSPSAMGKLICDIKKKRFLFLCQGGFNWVDVRDVVDAALAAEKKGRRGERYLISGEWVSLSRLAQIISKYSLKSSSFYALPLNLANFVAFFVELYGKLTKTSPSFTCSAVQTLQHYRYINNEKAKNELGYIPRPIEETIKDTLDWYEFHK